MLTQIFPEAGTSSFNPKAVEPFENRILPNLDFGGAFWRRVLH
jgi:hypothetical protein